VPVGEVAQLYEHERVVLAQGAHNMKFLHIFAIRNVLEVLRKRDLDRRALKVNRPVLTSS